MKKDSENTDLLRYMNDNRVLSITVHYLINNKVSQY